MLYCGFPGAVAAMVAADAFAGERERRTIETILSTPLRVRSIFLGKVAAAAAFAVAVSWALGAHGHGDRQSEDGQVLGACFRGPRTELLLGVRRGPGLQPAHGHPGRPGTSSCTSRSRAPPNSSRPCSRRDWRSWARRCWRTGRSAGPRPWAYRWPSLILRRRGGVPGPGRVSAPDRAPGVAREPTADGRARAEPAANRDALASCCASRAFPRAPHHRGLPR